MTAKYHQHVSTRQTPQSEAIPGSQQVENSAGGYTFTLDLWGRLDRFLILGNEGGTYYASERRLTKENAQVVLDCLKENYVRTVDTIATLSLNGRAPKNTPAIFALALAVSLNKESPTYREQVQYAFTALRKVCRIGTHLFQFVATCQELRGWGRSLVRGVQSWYLTQEPSALAYQVMKYQQREGWSHRDVLRLCHAYDPTGGDISILLNWIVKGWPSVGETPHPRQALQGIWAFEKAKKATSEREITRLIEDYNLPRECIPTQFLQSALVWEALLDQMPLTALLRNLGKMSSVGLLSPLSSAVKRVCKTLCRRNVLQKARIHPLSILLALKTYAQGRGEKGKLTWIPSQSIVDALNDAFYQSFGLVESTGKRWLFGLDVSGSMMSGQISGMTGITPRIATAVLALVTANVEPEHHFIGFTSGLSGSNAFRLSNRGVVPLTISPKQRLDDVIRYMNSIPFGGTDCSLPMLYALQQRLKVDTFVVLTDNETWAGGIHPVQALQNYRQQMGIPAKLIVVGMTATSFTIADPNDVGMLDVVGFDTATPQIMSDFARR